MNVDRFRFTVLSADGTRLFGSPAYEPQSVGGAHLCVANLSTHDHWVCVDATEVGRSWALAFDTTAPIPDSILYIGAARGLLRCELPYRYSQLIRYARSHAGQWLNEWVPELRDVWSIVFEYAAASEDDERGASFSQVPIALQDIRTVNESFGERRPFDPSDMHMLPSGHLLCFVQAYIYLIQPHRPIVICLGRVRGHANGYDRFAVDDVDHCVYYYADGAIHRTSLPACYFDIDVQKPTAAALATQTTASL